MYCEYNLQLESSQERHGHPNPGFICSYTLSLITFLVTTGFTDILQFMTSSKLRDLYHKKFQI